MIKLLKRKRGKSKHFKMLSKKLEEKKEVLLEEFKEKHEEVTKWAKKRGIKPEELVRRGARGVAVGAAAGAIVFTSGFRPSVEPPKQTSLNKELERESLFTSIKAKKDVTRQVKKALKGVNYYDEKKVAKILSQVLKIQVKPQLSGIRLNTTYGIMGYESHLTRYPGETLTTHFQTGGEYKRFAHARMAGGPGAWGYIAPSRNLLTEKNIDRERYYLVAQTFLSPNWGTQGVKEWFRHRKMVVVNPQNGEVVIGTIEDAGPKSYTGRSFGGSPEVMEALRFGGGGSGVYMFFVDDPQDKIPLGSYGL